MSSQAGPEQCGPEQNPSELDLFYNGLIGQAYLLREKRRQVELLRALKQRKTDANHKETKDD